MFKKILSLEERFWSKVDVKDDANACWNWTRKINKKGYGEFHLDKTMERAHRMAWILTNGKIPDGLYVLHKVECHNRACCNPSHLYLGTQFDNMKDKLKNGTSLIGNTFHRKLSEKQVEDFLFDYYFKNMAVREISRKYNVHRNALYLILAGNNWKKVLKSFKEQYQII